MWNFHQNMEQDDPKTNQRANFNTFTNYFGDLKKQMGTNGDYWGLNFMGTMGKTRSPRR